MHEKMCMFKNLLLMYDFLCPTHFRIELIYVRILSEQSTAIYNFPFWQLLTSSIYNTFNIVSFIKGLATIVPKGNPDRNIGQIDGMSEGDAAELRKYYNCPSKWNNQIKIINCGKYTTFKTLTLLYNRNRNYCQNPKWICKKVTLAETFLFERIIENIGIYKFYAIHFVLEM